MLIYPVAFLIDFRDVEISRWLAGGMEPQAGMELKLLQLFQIGLYKADALLRDAHDTCVCWSTELRAQHHDARDGVDAAGERQMTGLPLDSAAACRLDRSRHPPPQ